MTTMRLLSRPSLALALAALWCGPGCGTNPVTFPDGVLRGKWVGKLSLSGILKVGDESHDLDPVDIPFGITFADDGIPDAVPDLGQDPSQQGGFDIRNFSTPGQTRSSDVNTPGTTGTVKLTCVDAVFSESSMHYVIKLELQTMVTKDNVTYPSNSTTTTTIDATVVGQTLHFVNDTETTGNSPVETPPMSNTFVNKDFETTLHAEGDLVRD